jgi:hypothetical protein
MIQVYADSGFLSKGTGLLCVALCCSHVPASGKIFGRCLGDEVLETGYSPKECRRSLGEVVGFLTRKKPDRVIRW